MTFMKFIRFIIKDFVFTTLMVVFFFGLWAIYLFFIPEHSGKLMLFSIFLVFFIREFFFNDK